MLSLMVCNLHHPLRNSRRGHLLRCRSRLLLVLWGINVMISALIVANTSFKSLQWLGFYRASQFQILKDTSNIAPTAVKNLLTTDSKSTQTTYRYQVRLAVGKHFSKFTIILLPFYIGLRVGFFTASIQSWCVWMCSTSIDSIMLARNLLFPHIFHATEMENTKLPHFSRSN